MTKIIINGQICFPGIYVHAHNRMLWRTQMSEYSSVRDV